MANEFADTREDIDRASKASGAREMLDELAKKMRNGVHGKQQSIDDFYVKSQQDIPCAIYKVEDALKRYREKVSDKKVYYSAIDKQWYAFGPDEKLEDELEKIDRNVWRLKSKSYTVESFNLNIQFGLKNLILGGIEG